MFSCSLCTAVTVVFFMATRKDGGKLGFTIIVLRHRPLCQILGVVRFRHGRCDRRFFHLCIALWGNMRGSVTPRNRWCTTRRPTLELMMILEFNGSPPPPSKAIQHKTLPVYIWTHMYIGGLWIRSTPRLQSFAHHLLVGYVETPCSMNAKRVQMVDYYSTSW